MVLALRNYETPPRICGSFISRETDLDNTQRPSLEKGSFVKNQTGNFSCVKVLVCVNLGPTWHLFRGFSFHYAFLGGGILTCFSAEVRSFSMHSKFHLGSNTTSKWQMKVYRDSLQKSHNPGDDDNILQFCITSFTNCIN